MLIDAADFRKVGVSEIKDRDSGRSSLRGLGILLHGSPGCYCGWRRIIHTVGATSERTAAGKTEKLIFRAFFSSKM